MARHFNGTLTDFLQSAANVDMTGQATAALSFWAKFDSASPAVAAIVELSPNINSSAGALNAVVNGSVVSGGASGGVGGPGSASVPGTGNTSWHHYLINYTIAVGTTCITSWYLDNVSQSLTTIATDTTAGNFGSYVLNIGSRNGSSFFYTGALAQVALWKSVLSSADVGRVYNGTAQSALVAPAYYWPIAGTASPEPATVGGVNLTVTGTTQVSDPPSSAPTSVALTGPTSGYVANESTAFTATLNTSAPTGGTVVTLASNGSGDVFHATVGGGTVTTITIAAGVTTGTFILVPGTTGSRNVSITSAGLTVSGSPIAYTANARTIAVSPPVIAASATTTVTFTGGGTNWLTTAPTFTPSGLAGVTVGTVTVVDNTHATAPVTTGTSLGTVTYTGSVTGATTTQTIAVITTVIRTTNGFAATAAQLYASDGSTYGTALTPTTRGTFGGVANAVVVCAIPYATPYTLAWTDGSGNTLIDSIDAQILGNSTAIDGGTVTATATPTTTIFTATGANLHAPTGGYTIVPQTLLFTSGVNQGLRSTISNHVLGSGTHTFTVSAFPSAPSSGDTFVIV